MKLLISLLLLSATNTFAATNIFLTDACSGKATSLYTSNGIEMELEITKYNIETNLNIVIEFIPVNLVSEHINEAPVRYDYLHHRIDPDADSFKIKFNMPSQAKLRNAERRLNTSNQWMVRASWIQLGTMLSGTATHSFLRLDKMTSFYQTTSVGLCHWETKATISSKLYKNENKTLMEISREYEGISRYSSSSQVTLGPNIVESGAPVKLGENTVWFYDAQDQATEKVGTEQIRRNWRLYQFESGAFGNRHSFTRKKARRWVWDWNEQRTCKEYQIESEGTLDVGVATEDFYIIPEKLYATEEMNNFIEDYRPSINTCSKTTNTEPEDADNAIINKDKSILYYYRNKD